MAEHQDLEIVHGHIQHLRSRKAQRFQHAVGRCLVGASRQRECVGHHIGVEPQRRDLPSAALLMGLFKLRALPIGRQRRDALAAHRADGVAKGGIPLDRPGRSDIDQPQADSTTQLQRLLSPLEGTATVVLIPLQAENRNRQLEPKILLVGDVRLMDKIHITD